MNTAIRIPVVLALGLALAGSGACMDPGEPGKLVPATVEQDPSLPSIEVNGTLLHAEAFGDPQAPMIVMLHGGPGGDYRSLLPYRVLAADGYYVVFWDHRGAGLSKRHDAAAYTWDVVLEDLRQVIEHFSSSPTQPVVFIGHSWSATYATWFIDSYGDYGGRVRGAVLSESEELNDAVWSDPFMSPDDHARADFLAKTLSLPGMPRQHDDPDNPPPSWRSGAVVNKTLVSKGLDEGFDWTTHLGDDHHKVLFLRGELNENMPLWHQQELASHYAQSEIVTIPGGGHESIRDRQEQFLAQVRAYLATVDVSPVQGGVR